ncbi:MAG TPA: cupin domain-containing protein [Eubacteriaceae bacterium]|jgi:quercetin dioxygenase-like cupin family protein|nr:cupin domain-containing protein [Eubacteriaceae bacterium]
MVVGHKDNIEKVKFEGPAVKGATMKALISPQDGWEGYVMRYFELEVDGYSPRHTHPWPHINYIISGEGSLHLDGKDYDLRAGSYAYVPSDKLHQFSNTGRGEFKFICIVPEEGHK